MKANHNYQNNALLRKSVVINTSKIQNESKSQPKGCVNSINVCCYQYIKDTK